MADSPIPANAPDQVNLLDPEGNVVTGPGSMLQVALRSGYQLATPENIAHQELKAKYGGGVGNTLKAFGLGALRGATLNVSDPALTKSGLVSPETLSGLEEFHPAASTIGQLGGAAAGLLAAPEVEGLGAAEAALKAAKSTGTAADVAEAARAVEGIKNTLTASDLVNPTSAVAKIGGKVGSTAAGLVPEAGSGLAAKIISGAGNVAARGLGSSIEGAFYGAGQSLTEDALGDPDLTAEKVLSNIGYGGLFGGALGGITEAGRLAVPKSIDVARGTLAKGWTKLFGEPSEAAHDVKPFLDMAASKELPEVAEEMALPAGKPGLIPSFIAKIRAKAGLGTEADTLEALGGRGIKGKEVLSPDELNELHHEFLDSLQTTHDAMEKASTEARFNVRPQEFESLLKNSNPEKIDAAYGQFMGKVDAIRQAIESDPGKFEPAAARNMQDIIDNLKSSRQAVGEVAKTNAQKYEALDQARDELFDLRKNLGKSTKSLKENNTAQLVHEGYEIAKDTLRDESVWGEAATRYGEDAASLNEYRTALKNFRKDWMTKRTSTSGGDKWIVKPSAVSEFTNNVNHIRSKTRADSLRQYYKTAMDRIDQIDKTYHNAPFETFDRDAIEGLVKKNVDQTTRATNVVASQPGFGRGGLANIAMLMGMGHFGGVPGVVAGAAGSIAKGISNPETLAAKLGNLEKAAQKTSRAIDSGVSAIFSRKTFGSPIKGITIQKLEEHKDRIRDISNHAMDPEKLLKKVTPQTQLVYDVAPKTAAGMNDLASRATVFLASKAPQPTPAGMFSEEVPQSPAELAKFDQYYEAVDDPMSVLEQVKQGTISSESIEALQTVWPKLYSEMQQSILDKLSSISNRSKIPYRTRLSLSKFMGAPLDRSLEPQVVQAMQMASNSAHMQQQSQGPHPTQGGLGKVDIAQRTGTSFQNAATRKS